MSKTTVQAKIKIQYRIFVYDKDKIPGIDKPDEIKEGQEQILTGPEAEKIKQQIGGSNHGTN